MKEEAAVAVEATNELSIFNFPLKNEALQQSFDRQSVANKTLLNPNDTASLRQSMQTDRNE